MRDKPRVKKHRCQVCGVYGDTHTHHIYGGRWRSISERMNFVIELCPQCHEKAHNDADFSEALKHDCQLEYLETHSMSEWMELMHRNWVGLSEIRKQTFVRNTPELGPYEDEEDSWKK